MTNTTLPEAAQLFSQGETLREGEAAPTTSLRDATRTRFLSVVERECVPLLRAVQMTNDK
jgi:hypothetical protein